MAACPARWEMLLSGLVRHVRSTLPACDIVGHAQSAALHPSTQIVIPVRPASRMTMIGIRRPPSNPSRHPFLRTPEKPRLMPLLMYVRGEVSSSGPNLVGR